MSEDTAMMLKKLMEGQNNIVAGQRQLQQQLKHEIQELHLKLDSISVRFRDEIDTLKHENEALKAEIRDIRTELDAQEQFSKSKNVVLYNIPGSPAENRTIAEEKVRELLNSVQCQNRLVVAHRLNPKANSPLVAVFESKAHAQEVMAAVRTYNQTLANAAGLDERNLNQNNSKIAARPHLCSSLAQLMRAATALKTEAKWGWIKVLTSKMEVEIFKGRDGNGKIIPPTVVRSLDDVIRLREQLVASGDLPEVMPAVYEDTGATRKRSRSSATPELKTQTKRTTTTMRRAHV